MDTKVEINELSRKRQKHNDPGKILILVYVAIIFFFTLLGSVTRVFAEENHSNKVIKEISLGEVKQGELLFAGSEQGMYLRAPLVEQNVELNVSGMIVNALVQQHFINTTSEWLEAVYVFPLPDESAVKNMRMIVGERTIIGEIQEKQQARNTYERAKQEGKKTSLLAQKRPNIFTMAVANIPPHESIKVEIEYLDTVRFDNNIFSLRFPMVVGPRYIPGKPLPQHQQSIAFDETGWAVNTNQVNDASQITPPVVHPSEQPATTVDLKLTLNPGFPVKDLGSLYHGVEIDSVSDTEYELEFDGKVFADRDFVVEYRAANDRQISASLFYEKLNGEHYTYFMLMPPVEKTETVLPREVIFVLDKSGSMAGTSIRQAKKALQFAISRLSFHDRFNVIVFNNRASRIYAQPLPATKNNKVKALQGISALDAEGGTEIASALHLALDGAADRSRIRQVIFLTDGAVGNEKALFELIHKKLGDTRLFTIGIGSAPNSYFMSRAAAQGRGSFTYIGKLDEVNDKMTALFEKLENPVVTGLSLQTNGETTVKSFPSPLPDLYHGEPVIGVVKSLSPLKSLTVSGMNTGKVWSVELKNEQDRVSAGVATLWARKKIRSLMTALNLGAAEAEIRNEVIDTAIQHHLVTKYTSLVAVEQKVSRPLDQNLMSGQVKTNMPQGWQHSKVFGTSTRTSTHSHAALAMGSLALLLGAILLRYTTRRRAS